jgi:peptide/nickel transport system substrate-binding protein
MINDDHQLDDFFGYKPEHTDKPEKQRKERFLKPLKEKIRLLPKLLSFRERYIIFSLFLVIIGSIISIPFTVYQHFTQESPTYGGSFIEGVIGEPRFINPLLAQTNDTDSDLVGLVYSSLLKYNEDGKLIPDLAKSYEISSDGLNYTIYLKDNAKWHDGIPVTADDVIFTIDTAINSDYGSLQQSNWISIETERVDDTTVIFKLKNKYAQFLNNLTLGILPRHIWQDIKPINFALSEFNLKPIGSGPYQFDKLTKDRDGKIISYKLKRNDSYFDPKAFIESIQINFFDSEDELIDAYNRNEVQNLGYISSANLDRVKFKNRLNIHEVKMPRYFSAFFNQNQNKFLSDKNIRLALAYGTDRQALIDTVLDGHGTIVDSPLIGNILDAGNDVKKYNYDFKLAQQVLDETGWKSVDADGIRVKNKEKLQVKITTSTWPELASATDLVKQQWRALGVEVTVETLPTPALQSVIRDRAYDILLFGEILGLDPDPFTFWHSSGKKERGQNFALYDNKIADGLLEEARQTLNPIERMKKYDDFQKIVTEDIPAIFLYNSYYIYGQTDAIKGFSTKIIATPSDRFSNIEKWYINTKKIWKN